MKLLPSKRQGLRLALIVAVVCLCTTSPDLFAQGPGGTAISTATTTIKSYVPLVQKLIYAIAGVVALVGALSVYIKMNNEEQDVKKSIMMIVGACVFLVIAATALPAFFN